MNSESRDQLASSAQISSIRVARPTRDLDVTARFYVDALGLDHLGGFRNHDGVDGVFVGPREASWHLELTFSADGPEPRPTDEDLLVFYLARAERDRLSARLQRMGHLPFEHANPYWRTAGAHCFRDPDGYVITLCPHEAVEK